MSATDATLASSLNVTGFNWQTTADEVTATFKDNVKGRTFLITGTTISSIGFETALSLASQQPKLLILAGRSESKLQAASEEIKKQYPGTNIETLTIDLSSLSSVRKAAEQVTVELDVIICNAGIMAPPEYTPTEDGIESQFACNYLSHFLLVNLLMPRLLPAGSDRTGKRVISVSSSAYGFGNIQLDDINYSNGAGYNKWLAYGQSKTANILFSLALAEKAGVETFSLNPGNVGATSLGRFIPPAEIEALMKAYATEDAKIPMKSLQQGAATTLVASLDSRIKAYNGGFLEDCDLCVPHKEYARDKEAAKKLWEVSEGLVGQKFEY